MITLLERARTFSDRPAIVSDQRSFTYQQLSDASDRIAAHLLDGQSDLLEARIAFLVPSSFEYTAVQWGIWKAGGMAVPLCTAHPLPSLRYVLEDTQAAVVICHPDFESTLAPMQGQLDVRWLSLTNLEMIASISRSSL